MPTKHFFRKLLLPAILISLATGNLQAQSAISAEQPIMQATAILVFESAGQRTILSVRIFHFRASSAQPMRVRERKAQLPARFKANIDLAAEIHPDAWRNDYEKDLKMGLRRYDEFYVSRFLHIKVPIGVKKRNKRVSRLARLMRPKRAPVEQIRV